MSDQETRLKATSDALAEREEARHSGSSERAKQMERLAVTTIETLVHALEGRVSILTADVAYERWRAFLSSAEEAS